MPAENIQEVKDYIETHKDSEDVKTFLNGYNPLTVLTADNVNEFLNKTDVLKSHYDKHVSKGIETYKEKNKLDLEKSNAEAIAEHIKKNYPEMTEEQKRIKALELKDAENEKRIKDGDILANGIEFATAENIPVKLVKLVKGDSHESTQANLKLIKEVMLEREKAAVEAFIKTKGRNVADGDINVDSLKKKYEAAKKSGDTKEMMRINSLMYQEKNKK